MGDRAEIVRLRSVDVTVLDKFAMGGHDYPVTLSLRRGERIVSVETIPEYRPQWQLRMYRRREGVIEPRDQGNIIRIWIEAQGNA